MKKRFISMFLLVAMVLSMFTVALAVEEPTDGTETPVETVAPTVAPEDTNPESTQTPADSDPDSTDSPADPDATAEPTDEPTEPTDDPVEPTDEPAEETPEPTEEPTDEEGDEAEGEDLIHQTLTKEVDGKLVIVTGMLPEGVVLNVTAVALETVTNVIDIDEDSEAVIALDISLSLDGATYEIPESVRVTILGIDLSEAESVETHHIPDAGLPEVINNSYVDANGVAFNAEGFSVYVVTITGNSGAVNVEGKAGETIKFSHAVSSGYSMPKDTYKVKDSNKQDAAGFTVTYGNKSSGAHLISVAVDKSVAEGTYTLELPRSSSKTRTYTITVAPPVNENAKLMKEWYPNGTLTGKVYLLYVNKLPGASEINKGWNASLFGPSGNDVPFFTVTVSIVKMLEDHPEIDVEWKNGQWFISVGSGSNNAAMGAEALWNIILSYTTSADQANFQEWFSGKYYGYVLKDQGSKTSHNVHIDGVMTVDPPFYFTEVSINGETVKTFNVSGKTKTYTNSEGTPYTDIQQAFVDSLKEKYGNDLAIDWDKKTFTAGGLDYSFTLEGNSVAKNGYPNYTEKTKDIYYVASYRMVVTALTTTGKLSVVKAFGEGSAYDASNFNKNIKIKITDNETPANVTEYILNKANAWKLTIDLDVTKEYIVEEIDADIEGYELTTTYSKTDGKVTVQKDRSANLTITNTYKEEVKLYDLTVKKTVTGWTPGEGYSVRFDVYAESDTNFANSLGNATISSFDGNGYGTALIKGLEAGTYVVKETVTGAPSSELYTVTEEGTKTITIAENGLDAAFTNSYVALPTTGTITVTKTFAGFEDGVSVATALPNFMINVSAGADKTYTLTLNDSGVSKVGNKFTWTINDLAFGEYTVSESGYETNSSEAAYIFYSDASEITAKTVKLTNKAAEGTATFENTYLKVKDIGDKLTTLTVKKVDSADQAPLAGATFKLTGPDTYNDSKTTAEGGTVTFLNLKEGTYTLKETVAPVGYNATETEWAIVVKFDDGTPVIKITEDKTGWERTWTWISSIFTGKDGDQVVEGGTLTVTNTKKPTYSVDARYFTDGASDEVVNLLPNTTVDSVPAQADVVTEYQGETKTKDRVYAYTGISFKEETNTYELRFDRYSYKYDVVANYYTDGNATADNDDPKTLKATTTVYSTSKDGYGGVVTYATKDGDNKFGGNTYNLSANQGMTVTPTKEGATLTLKYERITYGYTVVGEYRLNGSAEAAPVSLYSETEGSIAAPGEDAVENEYNTKTTNNSKEYSYTSIASEGSLEEGTLVYTLYFDRYTYTVRGNYYTQNVLDNAKPVVFDTISVTSATAPTSDAIEAAYKIGSVEGVDNRKYDGAPYDYREVISDGKMSNGTLVYTLNYDRLMGELSIEKSFIGLNESLYPDEIKVDIYAGQYANVENDQPFTTVTLTRADGWATTIELPTNYYTLVEDTSDIAVSGYSFTGVTYSDDGKVVLTTEGAGFGITNSYSVIPGPNPPATYTLTVNWLGVDAEGNVTNLRPTENYPNLALNSDYSTVQYDFENYEFRGMGADSDPAEGTITKDTVVTYIYSEVTDIEDNETPQGTPEPTEEPDIDIDDEEPPVGELPDQKPPLGQKPDDGTDIEDETVPLADAPKTGDNSNLMLLWVLLAASALGCALWIILGARKRRS